MDPKIWSELPYDLLESIASFADIDSRRALGFKPRKLPPMDLPFRPTFVRRYCDFESCYVYSTEVFKYLLRKRRAEK